MTTITDNKSNSVVISFKTDVKIDPLAQISKSFHTGDREGKAAPLGDRLVPINAAEVENKQTIPLYTNVETTHLSIVNPLPAIESDQRDDNKLRAAFKKYPDCFSGVDKTRNVIKAKEFYEANRSKFVFDDKCSPEFIKKTTEEFLTICEWESGRKLFKDLFVRYPKLKYVDNWKNSCSVHRQLVQLAPEEKYHYIFINENNEKELYFQPSWITHVHELIHLYKHDESYMPVFDDPTLDIQFHNMEEQIVITGFGKESSNYNPVNENLFHYLSETPLRTSHIGILSQGDQSLSALDYVNGNAIGSLKKVTCDINASQIKEGKIVYPITQACYSSNLEMVVYLIKSGANIKVADSYGSPLHACIGNLGKGNTSSLILSELIKSGADINCKDQENRTPLMKALFFRDLKLMQVLLEAGSDVNCKDDTGKLLINACRMDYKEAFELLIKARVDLNLPDELGMTPLLTAIAYKNSEIAMRLIEEGADVNHISPKNGRMPLTSAIHYENWEIAKRLIEEGADINCSDKDQGMTPLMIALESKNWEIAKRLIEKGADINHTDKENGMTPLMIALESKNWEIAKRLIEEGADINHTNKENGMTPLMIARENDASPEIVELLSKSAINSESA